MKLLSLTLKNFKGIKSFTLKADGENVNIYGENATGKTTIYDAFLWLLFDKDSQNRKDFEIKTYNEAGEILHNLDHSVEGVFEVDNKELTLKKVYAEKWTKKRGSAKKEFTGHTVDHFIDGVPVKKGDYDDRIAAIVDENIFRLLTNPKYYNEHLHWQDRRQILLEVCGDVSDDEVIQSNKALAKLPDILGKRSLEEHRKVIHSRRVEVNRELEKIPVRIDEVTQGLPDLESINKNAHENSINILQSLIEGAEKKRQAVESGGDISDLENQIKEIKGKLLDRANELREKEQAAKQPLFDKRKELAEQLDNLDSDIYRTERKISTHQDEVKENEERMKRLRDEWHQVDSKSSEVEDTCPTCGQKLPKEQVQEAVSKFNQDKAEKLKAIEAKGKELRERNDELAKNIKEMESRLETMKKEQSKLGAELEKVEKQLKSPDETQTPDPEYQKLEQKKAELEEKIRAQRENNAEALAEIDAEITENKQKLRESEVELAKFDQYEAGQKRIKELEEQERNLAAEYEELEEELYLTEQFVISKVKLLEDKINSRFEMARFKLFNVLINGGIEECCETVYQGVPYGSLNNGAKIQVGLDIIRTLQTHYGITCPVWIDNRESVVRIPEMDCQIISLIVSEKDKKLRVETAEQKIKEAV